MEQNITRERVNSLHSEILNGLHNIPKSLPSKLFYDERGSELFDRICQLPEYYPTRTEMHIMSKNIREITDMIGDDVLLIEMGSGNSNKIRTLLDYMDHPAAYVPVDISGKYLYSAVRELQADYRDMRIIPVVADYTHAFTLPEIDVEFEKKIIFYPGSTIGNFKPDQAVRFLKTCAGLIGGRGNMIIGVDLIKESSLLEEAYNDREGITAAFNSNILLHVNRLLNANFRPELFKHKAFFNKSESRIEMHLISLRNQTVRLGYEKIQLGKGESIHTENSYKYSLDSFRQIALKAGFDVTKTWTDANDYFSIQYLSLL